jgi:hypothetical protein
MVADDGQVQAPVKAEPLALWDPNKPRPVRDPRLKAPTAALALPANKCTQPQVIQEAGKGSLGALPPSAAPGDAPAASDPLRPPERSSEWRGPAGVCGTAPRDATTHPGSAPEPAGLLPPPAGPPDPPVAHSVSVAVSAPQGPVPTLLGLPVRLCISDWWVPPSPTPELPPLWEIAGAHPIGTSFKGLPPARPPLLSPAAGCPDIHQMWFGTALDAADRTAFTELFAEPLPLPSCVPPAAAAGPGGAGPWGTAVTAGRAVFTGGPAVGRTSVPPVPPRWTAPGGSSLEAEGRRKKRDASGRERDRRVSPGKKARSTTPSVGSKRPGGGTGGMPVEAKRPKLRGEPCGSCG